jgi:pyruvate/2-oxoacid:ferredoxin oxidoreductase alpha subunit
MISSIFLEADDLEEHQRKMEAKYIRAQQNETRCEQYRTEDADLLVVGYGIVSRVLRSAVDEARKQGIKVGLFRPITLWPFPSAELAKTALHVEKLLVVELSNGQMVEDVKLSLEGRRPVEFYGRVGGNVPGVEELLAKIEEHAGASV